MRRVQIRKVARLGTGHTPSRSVEAYWDPADCTIPWLTLADVWQLRNGSVSVVHETNEKISPLGLANSAAVRHPAGTVAFSRTASVGFSCILGVDMATSQDFVTWTCGPKLDPRYLLWVLRGERDDILRRTQGSTHKTIYMPDIEQLTIPLPPLEVQRRIVEHLDREIARIDEVVESKRRLVAALQERTSSLIQDEVLPADSGSSFRPTLPTAWQWTRLRHCARVQVGVVVEPSKYFVDEGVPFIHGTDVRDGWIDASKLKYLSEESNRLLGKSTLRTGDLVVVRVGYPGRAAVVTTELDGANCASVLILRPRPGIDPYFLCHYLNSGHAQAQVAMSQYGAAQEVINAGDIADFVVPLPPIDAQSQIAGRVEGIARRAAAIVHRVEQQLALIAEHRRSLIAEAAAEREAA